MTLVRGVIFSVTVQSQNQLLEKVLDRAVLWGLIDCKPILESAEGEGGGGSRGGYPPSSYQIPRPCAKPPPPTVYGRSNTSLAVGLQVCKSQPHECPQDPEGFYINSPCATCVVRLFADHGGPRSWATNP